MHELGLAREIAAIVADHAAERPVRRVVLEIGQLACVSCEAIRASFEICRVGTVAAEAILEIREIPGRGRCRDCGAEFSLESLVVRCLCGSHDIDCLTGEELRVKEMELA